MAKITIVGGAIVVTSSMKMEDLQKIKKYRPRALTLRGGEDGKEELFAIGLVEGTTGRLNSYGAEFGGVSHDDAKLATITILIDGEPCDIKKVVADTFGSAILYLNKLEATLPAVLTEIDAETAEIMENITVA